MNENDKDIIASAKERMLADRKKPLTELEKLQAKLAKVQAQIDSLTVADTANDTDSSVEG